VRFEMVGRKAKVLLFTVAILWFILMGRLVWRVAIIDYNNPYWLMGYMGYVYLFSLPALILILACCRKSKVR